VTNFLLAIPNLVVYPRTHENANNISCKAIKGAAIHMDSYDLTPATNMATTTTFVSTTAQVSQMLASLNTTPGTPPALYVDIEGASLSRNGTVSIVTLYDPGNSTVYLVDVHTLQLSAFTTPSATATTALNLANPIGLTPAHVEPTTLKSVLESPATVKVFFDVRNDSDALFCHYGIRLQGIHDLQLMELATRDGPRTYVSSLANCIQYDLSLSANQRRQAEHVKAEGKLLFAPEVGGSYQVFNQRPLQPAIEKYCVQDVVHMPQLWHQYNGKLNGIDPFWRWMVNDDTEGRIADSQSANYQPNGSHKRLGWNTGEIVAARLRHRQVMMIE
jgi:exonuclease 3'-5' domain-containing protein 1